VATAFRLLSSGGDIGGRRFEMDGAPDPAPQQFVVKDTDPSSDIEKGLWCDPEISETLQDQPGGAAWPTAPVLGQFSFSPRRGEVAIGGYTMAIRHDSQEGG
jgi:hypothetical protein